MSKPKKAQQAEALDETQEPDYREIAEETFLGDLMNAVLDTVKAQPKPWGQLSQNEQDMFLQSIEARCTSATRRAMRIIASRDLINVPAVVESVTFKDGIKAVLKITGNTEGRHELADAEGSLVSVLLVPNEDDLLNDNGKPEAEPDQRGMELGHEYASEPTH